MDDQLARANIFQSITETPVSALDGGPISCTADRTTCAGKTRIAHIGLGTGMGGMERLLVEFARFTNRQRFDLVFLSLERCGQLAQEIEHERWPVVSFQKPPGLRPALVFKLARRLRQLRPRVVHTHNESAFFYGAVAAWLARVPRVIHTQHGQRFTASRRQNHIYRILSRLAFRVVSVSEEGHRQTISDGIHADRTSLIRNGIDLSRFRYTGPNATGPAMLVARLSPEKDVDTLIHAMKYVSESLALHKTAFTLDIVGDGISRPQLESLSRRLGLGDMVRFLGERSDIPSLLAGASMFVLSSLTEGISLTLLEAMAQGLPVVATRVGGNPEVVVDAATGILVPAQDPKALAAAMSNLLTNPELGREMGLQGRRRVEQEFTVQRMIQNYEKQYVDESQP